MPPRGGEFLALQRGDKTIGWMWGRTTAQQMVDLDLACRAWLVAMELPEGEQREAIQQAIDLTRKALTSQVHRES